MENNDPKKLSISLGGFSCQIEGYDDPMSVLRQVTEHMRELSSHDAAFLAQSERAQSNRPGQTIQVQPNAQYAQLAPAEASDGNRAGQRAVKPRVHVVKGAAQAKTTQAAPSQLSEVTARQRTDPNVDLVAPPEGEAQTLNDADRVDDKALSTRMAQLVQTKTVPEPKDFFQQMKADTPCELFEAGSAFLIHFQGYRHVTPKQVTRLLRRAEMVDEGGLANIDDLIAQLRQAGRIGGNMQEGLTLGQQSPFAAQNFTS